MAEAFTDFPAYAVSLAVAAMLAELPTLLTEMAVPHVLPDRRLLPRGADERKSIKPQPSIRTSFRNSKLLGAMIG